MKNITLKYIFIFSLLYISVFASTLTSLRLESNSTTLNVGEKATLTLIGIYSDNSTKTVDANVSYIITPAENAEVNGSVLTALKDGNVTVQAKVGTTLSNTINLHITWVVNGHVLPPEPDPTINNSTLLGVDVNDNGVRDDVERWIYETYDEYVPCHQELYDHVMQDGSTMKGAREVCEEHPIPYHPIVRAVAMQGARAAQIIIQEPEKAKGTLPILDSVLNCNAYFGFWAKVNGDPVLIPNETTFDKNLKNIQFNTTKRVRAYAKFNYNLSGGVYSSKIPLEMKKDCLDSILELLKCSK
jgi:hypothetical protein